MSLDNSINDRVCTLRNRGMSRDINGPSNTTLLHDIYDPSNNGMSLDNSINDRVCILRNVASKLTWPLTTACAN